MNILHEISEEKVVSMGDTMRIHTITPEIARDWLDRNFKNRPINQITIKKYVNAMLAGQWELNGETIKFAKSGRLLDGQHRLQAVLESGITIQSYVVRDLPEEVFDTIDCGKLRSIADALAVEGVVNSNNLGPALRLMYVQEQLGSVREMGTKMARIITNRDMIETYERHKDLESSITLLTNMRGMASRMSLATAAFLHYQFAKIHPGLAESFFIRLNKGTDQDPGHPIYELRKRLDGINKNSHDGRIEAIALSIQAWNAFKNRQSLFRLFYDRGSEYPVIEEGAAE